MDKTFKKHVSYRKENLGNHFKPKELNFRNILEKILYRFKNILFSLTFNPK